MTESLLFVSTCSLLSPSKRSGLSRYQLPLLELTHGHLTLGTAPQSRYICWVNYPLCNECYNPLPAGRKPRGTSDELTSGVSTVSKDSLSSDPSTFSAQETNDRSNILDHSQTATHAIGFVEFHCFRGLLRIEECYRRDYKLIFNPSNHQTTLSRDLRVSIGPGATLLTLILRD